MESQNSEEESEDKGVSLREAETRDAAAQSRLICEPGNVYGVTAAGQIKAVSPGGTVSNIGNPYASNGNVTVNVNGLGIGTGGSPVYAYQRSGTIYNSASKAEVLRFDVSTGVWASTGARVDSTANEREVQFVAGAVDLKTGRYLLGGYTPTNNSPRYFQIWEYNPNTNAVVYKGRIATDTQSTAAANGDMAFDANGNLFVLRGSGTTTTVYSVTAANLAAANGGVIPAAPSSSFTTMSNINGVAFDADGKAYLGSGTTMRRYNMPNWSDDGEVTTSLDGSTDLASCGSPPTIAIEKYVEGGRIAPSDQFNLSLRQGSASGTSIGAVTTTGNANGLQAERIGPVPTVRNVELHFAETNSGTTNLTNYASSYRCLVDGVQTVQGNGTTGKITVPSSGKSVECRFYNSPLIAQVNVHKQITDSKGENPKPGQNWSVGATAQATTGTISSSPSAATQQTNAAGTASWRFQFGASTNKANLSVRELMQNRYRFDNGKCEVTKLDGTKSTTTLTGPDANPNVGIGPGDVVDCTIVNTLKPASVSVGKQLLDFNGENPQPAKSWTVGASLAADGTSGVSINNPATAQTATNGRVEVPWTVDFPNNPTATGNVTVREIMQEGYEFVRALCVITADDGSTSEQRLAATSSNLTGLKPGDTAECSFTNKPISGAVAWEKIDESGAVLSGSEWKVTGTQNFNGGQALEIQDCVANDAAKCTGADRNPQAGGFKLTDLPWGNYTLEETKAPAGYYPIKDPIKFEVASTALTVDLGAIENARREGPAIPLTGGVGRDFFAILGGGIITFGLLGSVIVMLRRRHQGVA